MVAQLLGQHLLGGGSGHATEVVFLWGDIEDHRVADLGVFGHLLNFGQGDLMVFAFDLFNNDFRSQDPVALLLEIKAHVEVGEVVLLKGVFADAQVQGAPIALVALEQGFAQGGLHHGRRQFLFFADVLDQVVQTGEKNQSHGSG